MMGRKGEGNKLFYVTQIEELIPEDHVLVRLKKGINFEFIRDIVRRYYPQKGQPSLDPTVLFKMMVIGYLFGIPSERKLAKEIQVNLAYRYFLGYAIDENTPHHSVLSKARKRFDVGVFESIFLEVVKKCQSCGLVGGTDVYVDSTIVEANASLSSFQKVESEARRFLQAVSEDEQKAVAKKDIGKHFDGRIDEDRLGKRRRRNFANRQIRSQSDPDARIVFKTGMGRKACYKGHAIVDGKSRVVVSVDAGHGEESDVTALPSLFQQLKKNGLAPTYIAGDTKYGSIESLIYLQNIQKIQTAIRPIHTRNRPGFISVEAFVYEPEKDRYRCPEGAVLRFKNHSHSTFRKYYKANPKECSACRLKAICVNPNAKARIVSTFYGPWVKRAQNLVDSPLGKSLLRKRKTCVEGVFGEAKTQHRLKRMFGRGIKNAKIQLFLTAISINLKRLVGAFGQNDRPCCPQIAYFLCKSLASSLHFLPTTLRHAFFPFLLRFPAF